MHQISTVINQLTPPQAAHLAYHVHKSGYKTSIIIINSIPERDRQTERRKQMIKSNQMSDT